MYVTPNPYDVLFLCNTKGTGWEMVILVYNMVIVLLAVLYYLYYLLLAKHTGTYNETLKCCLENYTELEWKSVQTSLVSFCLHLNGGATSAFVWSEFTHGQVWSSLGVVTESCKEYTIQQQAFPLVLTLCNRIIHISCVYCLSPSLLWISLIQITVSSIVRFVLIAAFGSQNAILQKGKVVSLRETS